MAIFVVFVSLNVIVVLGVLMQLAHRKQLTEKKIAAVVVVFGMLPMAGFATYLLTTSSEKKPKIALVRGKGGKQAQQEEEAHSRRPGRAGGGAGEMDDAPSHGGGAGGGNPDENDGQFGGRRSKSIDDQDGQSGDSIIVAKDQRGGSGDIHIKDTGRRAADPERELKGGEVPGGGNGKPGTGKIIVIGGNLIGGGKIVPDTSSGGLSGIILKPEMGTGGIGEKRAMDPIYYSKQFDGGVEKEKDVGLGHEKAGHGAENMGTGGGGMKFGAVDASGGPRTPTTKISGTPSAPSENRQPGEQFRDCDACPWLTVVPAAHYLMGAPDTDPDAAPAELPQMRVRIPRRFAVGRFEITVGEYSEFIRQSHHQTSQRCEIGGKIKPATYLSPGFRQDPSHPVVCISWSDAQAYVAWLSQTTQRRYRLVSAAEWEYVARAGSTTRYAFGNDVQGDVANFNGRFGGTKAVGTGFLNRFEVADMHGNAAELVADCASDTLTAAQGEATPFEPAGGCTKRVVKGGSWQDTRSSLRSSARAQIGQDEARNTVGFRVARSVQFKTTVSSNP